MLMQVVTETTGTKFSYVILPGNESILMADAMATRSWWKAVEKGSPNNFWWGGNGQRFGWPDFQKGTQAGGFPKRHSHNVLSQNLKMPMALQE